MDGHESMASTMEAKTHGAWHALGLVAVALLLTAIAFAIHPGRIRCTDDYNYIAAAAGDTDVYWTHRSTRWAYVGIYKLAFLAAGVNRHGIVLGEMLVHLLTVLGVAYCGWKLGGAAAAWLCVLLAAFFPPILHLTAGTDLDPLLSAWLAVAIGLLVDIRSPSSGRTALLLGLACGLAFHTRITGVYVGVFAGLALLWIRPPLKVWSLCGLGFAATIACDVAYHIAVLGDPLGRWHTLFNTRGVGDLEEFEWYSDGVVDKIFFAYPRLLFFSHRADFLYFAWPLLLLSVGGWICGGRTFSSPARMLVAGMVIGLAVHIFFPTPQLTFALRVLPRYAAAVWGPFIVLAALGSVTMLRRHSLPLRSLVITSLLGFVGMMVTYDVVKGRTSLSRQALWHALDVAEHGRGLDVVATDQHTARLLSILQTHQPDWPRTGFITYKELAQDQPHCDGVLFIYSLPSGDVPGQLSPQTETAWQYVHNDSSFQHRVEVQTRKTLPMRSLFTGQPPKTVLIAAYREDPLAGASSSE